MFHCPSWNTEGSLVPIRSPLGWSSSHIEKGSRVSYSFRGEALTHSQNPICAHRVGNDLKAPRCKKCSPTALT